MSIEESDGVEEENNGMVEAMWKKIGERCILTGSDVYRDEHDVVWGGESETGKKSANVRKSSLFT